MNDNLEYEQEVMSQDGRLRKTGNISTVEEEDRVVHCFKLLYEHMELNSQERSSGLDYSNIPNASHSHDS